MQQTHALLRHLQQMHPPLKHPSSLHEIYSAEQSQKLHYKRQASLKMLRVSPLKKHNASKRKHTGKLSKQKMPYTLIMVIIKSDLIPKLPILTVQSVQCSLRMSSRLVVIHF
jgi:hypothetical protein